MKRYFASNRLLTLLLLLGTAVCATACRKGPPPTSLPATPLDRIDAGALDRLLEKRRGKAVLVEFWATWCGPCLELLPHTVELHDRFRERGLAVITVSMDDPADGSAVGRTLARHGAATENYLSSYGIGSEGFSAFGIKDGALPHLRLYDREGKLHRTFAGAIEPAEVERSVEQLLERR